MQRKCFKHGYKSQLETLRKKWDQLKVGGRQRSLGAKVGTNGILARAKRLSVETKFHDGTEKRITTLEMLQS